MLWGIGVTNRPRQFYVKGIQWFVSQWDARVVSYGDCATFVPGRGSIQPPLILDELLRSSNSLSHSQLMSVMYALR